MKYLNIDDFASSIPLLKGDVYWANGEPHGAFKEFTIQLINQGCFTVDEVKHAMRKRYPNASEKTIYSQIYHATNIKGTEKDKMRLPYKAVIDKNGIISFDKKFPAGKW